MNTFGEPILYLAMIRLERVGKKALKPPRRLLLLFLPPQPPSRREGGADGREPAAGEN